MNFLSNFPRTFALVLTVAALGALAIQSLGCGGMHNQGKCRVNPANGTAIHGGNECDSISGTLPGPTTNPTTQPTNNCALTSAEFDDAKNAFAEVEDLDKGLGPVFNAEGCATCHRNTAVGETSQINEIRAGHQKKNGEFIEPPGGTLMFQRAIHPDIQVHVRESDEIRTLRMTTNVLGDGFIEGVPDQAINDYRATQPASMRGTIVLVPVPVGPKPDPNPDGEFTFIERVGRFGWKCQHASLLAFSADAYLNEMGITSPLQPNENTSLGRSTDDYNPLPPDDIQDDDPPFGEDVAKFTAFMRATNQPPQAHNLDGAKVARGSTVFNNIQCAVCHRPQWTTGPASTDLGDTTLSPAIAGRSFNPYSDFMLHDVGTGDGIVQTQHAQRPFFSCRPESVTPSPLGKQNDPHIHRVILDMYKYVDEEQNPLVVLRKRTLDKTFDETFGEHYNGNTGQRYMDTALVETACMMRTAPLWGVRARPQLMHDGRSLTLDDAIRRHARQAKAAKTAYLQLSEDDRCALLTFLMSL
jgi:CxxC motif-containing protein (DUF1111 family)